MIGSIIRNNNAGFIHSSPRKVPFQLFFASLLLSATKSSASIHHHHSTFVTMARSSSAVQHRRSARLQKRSTSGNDLQNAEQYNSLKVSELRDLLREKGLAVSGVKAVLINRLLESVGYDSTTTCAIAGATEDVSNNQPKAKRVKKKSVDVQPTSNLKTSPPAAGEVVDCLPRTRELQLKSAHEDPNTTLAVVGVDEAGRGPLAGCVSII